MKVLIVVDVQNDFCPGGSLEVKQGDEIVKEINRVRDEYDLVIFTQDWHPKDHLSFATNHPGKQPGEFIKLGSTTQILWPVHCVQGTAGAMFHSDLKMLDTDPVFRKGTDPSIDSYSAFYDNAHEKSTGLSDFLKSKGVTELTICGLATDYCVKFSVLDAIAEGFNVRVLQRACRAVNIRPGDGERALLEMKRHQAQVV